MGPPREPFLGVGAGSPRWPARVIRSVGRARVIGGRRLPMEAPAELVDPELDDDEEGLDDDPAGHLRLTDATIAEDDRDLGDTGAGAAGPERHLDLEDIAAGVDAIERRWPPACRGRQALKPPVRSCGSRPRTIRAKVEPPRETKRREPPVADTATRDVARADDEVRRPSRPAHEPGRYVGVVRASRRPSGRPARRRRRSRRRSRRCRPVRGPACRADGGRACARRRWPCVGDRAGAVGRGVVDHEQGRAGQRGRWAWRWPAGFPPRCTWAARRSRRPSGQSPHSLPECSRGGGPAAGRAVRVGPGGCARRCRAPRCRRRRDCPTIWEVSGMSLRRRLSVAALAAAVCFPAIVGTASAVVVDLVQPQHRPIVPRRIWPARSERDRIAA